jgi:non-canonical poly(A) RNA polymerase PAPD5/7
MPYKANNADRLCIIDPNNSANDISGGSGNTAAILQCFSQTYSDLQTRMGELQYVSPAGRRNQSILKCILGGNYTSFKLQREHLAHVYEKLYGPI